MRSALAEILQQQLLDQHSEEVLQVVQRAIPVPEEAVSRRATRSVGSWDGGKGAAMSVGGDPCWLPRAPFSAQLAAGTLRGRPWRVALGGSEDATVACAGRELEHLWSELSGCRSVPGTDLDPMLELWVGRLEDLHRSAERSPQGTASHAQVDRDPPDGGFLISSAGGEALGNEERASSRVTRIAVVGADGPACLRGVFGLVRKLALGANPNSLAVSDSPSLPVRMLDHWDNLDGSVERGYAGRSLFFANGGVRVDPDRQRQYARLLASIGIDGVCLNNVNVESAAVGLVQGSAIDDLSRLGRLFSEYGIRLYLSVSFASPLLIGGLATADPRDRRVRAWWRETLAVVDARLPGFGGVVVKADSEGCPGPHDYGCDHVAGANMLADALAPVGGTVFWRAFVYDAAQDWRDRRKDRARAAYDEFHPLDGRFAPNVVLQVKAGPMDFQVREPVSPLLGGLTQTNVALEVQLTQEYTGQAEHLCYLPPSWSEVLGFPTGAGGRPSPVADILNGAAFGQALSGIVGVANVGDDPTWCGHVLAQANLYGFGRLAWDPSLSPLEISREWAQLTFGSDAEVVEVVSRMLCGSRATYERYTAPLGVGWMVRPHTHDRPAPEGYEYDRWGTYHRADRNGLGVDRTSATGSGMTAQYHWPWREIYEDAETCPDELLCFFHHVSFGHRLHSGQTVIQHIYDSHFAGVEEVGTLLGLWRSLQDRIDPLRYRLVRTRLSHQLVLAMEWRDVLINYFWRLSGVADARGRPIPGAPATDHPPSKEVDPGGS